MVSTGGAAGVVRAWSRQAAALVIAALAGCSAEPVPPRDPDPRNQPVDGAVAVTEWRHLGQPGAPFGPGGPRWTDPLTLLTAMSGAMATGGAEAIDSALAFMNASATAVGWIRVGDPNGPRLATDLQVD